MTRPRRRSGERDGALRRWGAAAAAVVGAAAFAVFYYKYVPIVPGFQAFLAPVLAAVFLFTLSGTARGLTALVFALPLINNLPYFFGIYGNIPHAPTALPLLLVFALGLAARAALFPGTKEAGGGGFAGGGPDSGRQESPLPMGRPIAVFAVLVSVSMIVTALRYAGFYPFAQDEILELVVNAGGVRAGGAIMSVVFSGLSYLAGFLVFAVVWRARGGRAFSEKLLRTLTVAAVPALAFALFQAWRAPALGNMPSWVDKAQINGTFKDPNSLAGFLAAFVPVALGLAWAARGWKKKALPLVAAVLGLAAVPHAGSRSGLAGLAVGLAVFGAVAALSWQRHKPARTGRMAFVSVLIVVAGVVLAVVILGLVGSTLSERILWSADVLRGDLPVDNFFNLRLTLWDAAIRMAAAFPLSGVGVGAYIVELPNVQAFGGQYGMATDSALNYVLQAGAELGLAGLLLALWFFGRIAARAVRTVRSRPGDFVVLGTAAGLAAFFVSFVFHTFIGSFEIIAFFWLLAGLLFRMTEGRAEDTDAEDGTGSAKTGKEGQAGVGDVDGLGGSGGEDNAAKAGERVGGKSAASAGRRKRAAGVAGLAAAGLGVFLFGAVHLRNSLGPLSIERRTEDFAWLQDFGFYGRERDARGFHFRWSGKRVGLVLPDLGVPLVLPVMAMHPDIAGRPVVVRVCRADRNFHPIEVLLEHVQRDKDWAEIEIPSGGEASGSGMIRLLIEVDRTWSPARDLGVPDPRELGFAMGAPWYRHHEEPPAPELAMRSETYDVERWEGPWGSLLAGNGTARIKFRFEPEEGEAESVEYARGERHAGDAGKGAEHTEGAGHAGGAGGAGDMGTGVEHAGGVGKGAERAALVLRMRGDRAAGIWPYAVIRLNGRVIGRTFVRSADWVNVVLYPEMAPGEHVLSVEFTNDFNNPRTGADRNLYLGPLTLLWLLEVSQNKQIIR